MRVRADKWCRALSDAVQAVAQADGGGGLALARRGRGDGGHQDQLAVRTGLNRLDELGRDFTLGRTVLQNVFARNVELRTDLCNRFHRGFAGNLNVALGHA